MRNIAIGILAILIGTGIYLFSANKNNHPDFINEITSAREGSEQYYRDLSKYYQEILAWEKSQSKQPFGAQHLAGDVSEQKAVIMQRRDYIREILANRHDR